MPTPRPIIAPICRAKSGIVVTQDAKLGVLPKGDVLLDGDRIAAVAPSLQADAETVDCSGHCQASCEGSCRAEANIDCQINCQAGGFVDCQSRLTGGCQVECERPEGALFCDSQYVDHGGNLEECIESLRAVLDIEVSGYAEGSCGNGRCEAEAGGSISCAVAPEGRGAMGVGALVLLMLGLRGVGRRRE